MVPADEKRAKFHKNGGKNDEGTATTIALSRKQAEDREKKTTTHKTTCIKFVTYVVLGFETPKNIEIC